MKRECPWVLATADAYRWLLLLLSPLLSAQPHRAFRAATGGNGDILTPAKVAT
jgi:hypothetical protein